MAIFCIPKHLVEKLKASAIKGEIDVKKLYGMSSDESRAFFTKFTNPELGKFLNTEWEKAKVSKYKGAITDFVKSTFSPQAKEKPTYANILSKIAELDEMGVLNPKTEEAFLKDLVADKLGISVSADEVRQIAERAQKIDEAQKALGDDLGSPFALEENMAFFKAKHEMDNYLLGLNGASKLRVWTSTIGRGVMLLSVKSPLLNIGSNIELAVTEGIARRLTGTVRTTDNQMAKDYIKMVWKVYQATGYDLSRMQSLSDSGASGSRVLGGDMTHSQGPGATRKVGRIVEDVVFKQLMGAPDVAFAASHFADSVNLNALSMAKGDKEQAKVHMKDAMRIVPQTPQGEMLRAQAIMDAEIATWTNDTWASKVSLGIRKILNDVSGDARIGDLALPFIKTPANVIATGMDYAGLGVPKAVYKGIQAIRSGELGNKRVQQSIARDLIRSGMGLAFAAILAASLDDDDFVGAYDPARTQIEQLRNSSENSFRSGGKWVSTDWLGPFAVPFSAIMYARKAKGKSAADKAFAFGQGVGSNIVDLPGITELYDQARTAAFNKDAGTAAEAKEAAWNTFTDFVYSHTVPSILGDIAKATDQYERDTGKTSIGKIQARIPGLRQKLPVKKNVFGEQMKDEPAWSNIAFGSRVKTDRETPLIKEINAVLTSTGKSVTFTDWNKTSNQSIAQFKEKRPQDFGRAKDRYSELLRKRLEEITRNPRYQNMTAEDKLKEINNADTEMLKKTFEQFLFRYQAPAVKKRIPL